MKKVLKYLLTLVMIMTINVCPVFASETKNINFDLQSTVYDDGEAIDTVIMDVSGANINENKINKDMFKITAKSSSVYTAEQENEFFGENSKHGLQHCGLYNETRHVKSVEVKDGKIILHLDTNDNGKGTLDFTANFTTFKGCNSLLNIDYSIEPVELELNDGTKATFNFKQNEGIKNDEIEKFNDGEYNGFKYQFYTPENANDGKKHPLIVWFHGGGESGYRGLHYNNVSQLKANRGAVAFVTDKAQDIFGGAYVLAPQTPHEWSESLTDAKKLIDKTIAENNVDTSRIYVYGCSAGGYMALDMVTHNPNFFAAVVATCPAIDQQNIKTYGQGREITDEELKSINIPIWLVQAKDDTTVKYEESALRVYNLLKDKGAILTTYETGGHSSWIHTAKNEPSHNGEHVWQWTSRQVLKAPQTEIKPDETTIPNSKNNPSQSVKTGDGTKIEYYVIVSGTSALLLAHYVLKKKDVIFH